MKFAVDARNICISFDMVQILHEVDFFVKKGEIHALLGSNGAGKSTLMKILTGIYKKDSGKISIFGKTAEYESPQGARLSGIAMVFQDFSLVPSLSVTDNIFLQDYRRIKKKVFIDGKKARRKARQLFSFIGLDSEIDCDEEVANLSTGKQQIVEIAKALSLNPRILILDEPTASLSNTEIQKFFKVLRTLKEKGISIIYITHYLKDVFRICDSLTLLRDGRVVLRKGIDEISLESLVDSMAETRSEKIVHQQKSSKRKGPPLLEAVNLCTDLLHDISIKLYPGEIVGIAGLLGSGRTELLRSLFGIDPLRGGNIYMHGEQIHAKSPTEAIAQGIHLVPENRRTQGLIMDFSIIDNITLPVIDTLQHYLLLSTRKAAAVTESYIDKLHIKAQHTSQAVKYLSGGNQQKIVVGKCLASKSCILLLDDPTFGVDIHAKQEIMKIIEDYVSEGHAALFVSSEFSELATFCHCIYLMKKGTVTEFIPDRMNEDDLLYRVQ